uniref:Uncharacterized protein n=1 Tax=Lactuca sativa TaxID=4236 RepID=A0A9R1WQB8_LACSA|nr:hypothetical protein LSAT_V11C900478200 [Lactuca sativa]
MISLIYNIIWILQTRGTQKVYINKEEKLRKEKEMIQHGNKRGVEAKKTKVKDRGGDKQIEVQKGNAYDRGKSENENKKGGEAEKTKGNEEVKIHIKLQQKKTLKKIQIKEDHQRIIIDVTVQKEYGQVTERAIMESLYANTMIFAKVLDTWGDLLNHQELERDNAYVSSTLSDERKYEKIKENFHDNIDEYKKILNIKDIDMIS